MILTPFDAACMVNTGDKIVFYAPGSGEGKRLWREAVQENLAVLRDCSIREIGYSWCPGDYSGKIELGWSTGVRILSLPGADFVIIDDHVPDDLIEPAIRSAHAVASAWGGRVVEVDNFLTNDERASHAVPPIGLPPLDPTLPPCIIVDLDGTLANSEHRRPFGDVEKIKDDTPYDHVLAIINAAATPFDKDLHVFFLTGRGGEFGEYEATHEWLAELGWNPRSNRLHLLARPVGDNRRDDVIKLEAYIHNIAGRYNPILVLDDRPRVVRMWNRLGLPVLQCNPYVKGEF